MTRHPAHRAAALAVALVVACGAGGKASAQASSASASTATSSAPASTATSPAIAPRAGSAPALTSDEFVYLARPGDTLIGLSRRLLLQPARWRDLQRRNAIPDPRRIPRGSRIRIPYEWLRLSRQSATVVERVGKAFVDGREVATGATVAAGASLETGADGSLTLEFTDGSTLVLQPSSRLRLETLQRVEGAAAEESVLQLERGKVETHVQPRGAMGRFEIRTPAAVSAVRGTEFRASYRDDGGATTETLSGTVGVAGAGADVAVRGGFGTRAERGLPPATPVPLLPAPALDSLPASNDVATLRWSFAPVAGAAAYRHQLARDGLFRALVGEAVTRTPEAEFAALADGHYWLRSRAIDQGAIEGLDATREIEQRRRLEGPAAIDPVADARRVGASTRFEWAAAAGASGYLFQLARDAAFADRVSERRLEAGAAGATVTTSVDALAAGRYLWRVAAIDAAGVAGHWGTPQGFVQKAAPVTAQPAAPTGSAATAPGQYAFRWTATEAGQSWEWQLARRGDFREPRRSGAVASPQLVLDGLQPGRHYLRLRSRDADGFVSPWGEAREFDVPWPTWVRFLLPVVLLIPSL